MSLMVAALQPHMMNGFMSLGGRGAGGLSELLIDKTKGYDLDFDSLEESISVDFRDNQLIIPALGVDCCRFATAAFQSIVPISEEIVDKDTLAWSMVKLYYAAFYAGHSIIRILGESCSFLERIHTTRINSVASAIGKTPGFRIERGLYHCTVNASGSAVKYIKAAPVTGGAHESFWGVFERRLRHFANNILVGHLVPAEAQLVFVQLQALQQILGMVGPSMHGALSMVRNDLQYKHQFGVWFPVQIKKRERELLGRLVAQWLRDPMTIDVGLHDGNVLRNFVVACAFLVGLCRVLIFRIAERSTEGARSFVCFGPVSFLRGAGIAA